jgi:hypothetical protein
MKKRTVGILANYDASEQCLCALFLARYISKCYRYALWFTPAKVKQSEIAKGFSHQWDKEILVRTNPRINTKIKRCDTFFFFEPDRDILKQLPRDSVTAYVINPYAWNTDTYKFARQCTYALLLSPEWMSYFGRHHYLTNALIWPIDPAMQCIPRQNLNADTEPRLFYPAYGLNNAELDFVKRTADLVKLCCPQVKSVVGLYGTKKQAAPGYDTNVYDWRLQKYMQQSDWIIYLNPRPIFSLFPALAGGYGIRWAGFNMSPNTDNYNMSRRHLIESKTKCVCDKIQWALPDLDDTVMQIVQQIETPLKCTHDPNRTSGAWEQRRAEFLKVTGKILGIKKVKY